MDADLEKANRTAVDAAKAMIKIFDFAASVLKELAETVEEESSLELGRYDAVRYAIQDARIIQRYARRHSRGESQVRRYLYSLFSIPDELTATATGTPHKAFLLVSLVNQEERFPEIVYGILEQIKGIEKTEKDFCEFFLLWLNEQLDQICKSGTQTDHGWEIEGQVSGRAEANKLKARLAFQRTTLFDISEENLPERAEMIVKWFNDRLASSTGKSKNTA
jgi:hypothetical protein